MIWGVLAGLCVAIQSLAWAYVPPSEFIVKNIAAKHTGLRTIKITQKISQLDPSLQVTTQVKEVLRLDFRTETAQSVIMDAQGQAVHLREGVPIPGLWKLVFSPNPATIASVLMQSGVPIQTEAELLKLPTEAERRAAENESIVRLRGHTAWLLGAEKSQGKLWIEKDVFLPFQWGRIKDGDWCESQFDLYASQKGFPYPRQIEILQRNNPEDRVDLGIRLELTEIVANFESREKTPVVAPDMSDAVKKLLENYYRLIQ